MSREVMQKVLSSLINLQPIIANGLLDERQLAFIDPYLDVAAMALIEELAKPEEDPFGYFKVEPFNWVDCAETDEGAKALYEAPLQRQPLTAWQPIETAPKTAKAHLVWCAERKNTYAVYWDGRYWVIFGGDRLDESPTHWMPLPAAPAAVSIGAIK